MHIVIYQPEIPPNTGNIIRLCANMGARLHLIEPLGFEITDKRLRRAGLDYRDKAVIQQWPDFDTWRAEHGHCRVLAASKFGTVRYDNVSYRADDALLFGRETSGLPPERHADADAVIYLPMQPDNRSLNLSNSVAIMAYEAWRQLGFAGCTPV